MSWTYYSFENEVSIGDFQEGEEVFTIDHYPPKLSKSDYQAEFSLPRDDFVIGEELRYIREGCISITKEQLQQENEHQRNFPFEGMERSFFMGGGTSLHGQEYDLELTRRTGLIRKIWTRVSKGNVTHAIYKCAGRGNAEDFLIFAKYAGERLQTLSQEIISPNRANVPDRIWNRLAYAEDINWENLQKEFCRSFYDMFSRSVAYSAVEPSESFRIDANTARQSLEMIGGLK